MERGYIDVVADVRGTGDSGGQFGLFDPAQQQDGATLVRWAAGLPHSSGKVGLYGASYLAIDQLLTVGQLDPTRRSRRSSRSSPATTCYRDTSFERRADPHRVRLVLRRAHRLAEQGEPVAEIPQDPLDTYDVELQRTADLGRSTCRCS